MDYDDTIPGQKCNFASVSVSQFPICLLLEQRINLRVRISLLLNNVAALPYKMNYDGDYKVCSYMFIYGSSGQFKCARTAFSL